MKNVLITFLILICSTLCFGQKKIFTENQHTSCHIEIITSSDSITTKFILTNKLDESIYIPSNSIKRGVEQLDANSLLIYIGCNQTSSINVNFNVTEIKAKDSLVFTSNIPLDFKSKQINDLQVSINYILYSKLKKVSKRNLPEIWFTDYMRVMEWFEFMLQL